MQITVRPTGILIEDGKILIVKQDVTKTRHWSLPGGKMEPDETIEQRLTREIKEETGLEIKVGELLYVTDRIKGDDHIVHITFLIDMVGEKRLPSVYNYLDTSTSTSSSTNREIRMVPVDKLPAYGFSPTFYHLVKDGFPGHGGYKGDFHIFYGE